MLVRLASLFCIALAAILPAQAQAQDMDRIAAVVNEDAISIKELAGRVHIALLLSNLPNNRENQARIAPQLLRKMIDERLQLQEGNRLKINVPSTDIDGAISNIEQQNNMPKGALVQALNRAAAQPELFKDQMRADMTWARVTTRVLSSQIRVAEDEINDRMENIRERQGQPEYLAHEIFLPVESASQDADMRGLGEKLIEQFRRGTPFTALARQFSRAPSAGQGGVLGWIHKGGIDDDIINVVSKMAKGEVSQVLAVNGGYQILFLADKRIAGQIINPDESVVSLVQIFLPVPPGAPPKDILQAKAEELTRNAKSCLELESIGRQLGSNKSGKLGPAKIAELPANMRRTAALLPVNRPSDAVDTPDGIRVVMVCSRIDNTIQSLPTREQVRRQIEDERMDMLARRYLRDLRRSAFIDLRS